MKWGLTEKIFIALAGIAAVILLAIAAGLAVGIWKAALR